MKFGIAITILSIMVLVSNSAKLPALSVAKKFLS